MFLAILSADGKLFLERFKKDFYQQNVEKHPKKLHTYGSWEIFFSAALTADNSPELHFCFINSFIQPSQVGSLERIRKSGVRIPAPEGQTLFSF